MNESHFILVVRVESINNPLQSYTQSIDDHCMRNGCGSRYDRNSSSKHDTSTKGKGATNKLIIEY